MTLRQSLSKLTWKHAVIGALVFGVLLRAIHFGFGRMLWLDEAMVALNLEARSGAEFLAPLDFSQVAPVGWLLLEDWVVSLFNNYEYASRLPAFFAGVLSLFLFYKIAVKEFSPPVAFVAVFVFSTSFMLAYFSAELKPYAFDVLLWAICALIALRSIGLERLGVRELALLSATFLIGSATTFAAPMVVGGIGGVLIIRALLHKDYRAFVVLSLAAGVAAAIYLYLSLSSYQPQIELGGLDLGGVGHYFNRLYAPFPPTSLSDIVWYPQVLNDTFGTLFGVESAYIFILLAGAGTVILARRDAKMAALMLGPVIVALALSALKIYPIMPRLALYLIPIAILLAGYALEMLFAKTPSLIKLGVFGVLLLMCIGSVGLFRYESFFAPANSSKDLSAEMATLSKSVQPDDVIAVRHWSLPAFLMYRHKFQLENQDWTIMEEGPCMFSSVLDAGKVRGVWLLKGRFDARGLTGLVDGQTIWRDGEARYVSIERPEKRLEYFQSTAPTPDLHTPIACDRNADVDDYLFGGRQIYAPR